MSALRFALRGLAVAAGLLALLIPHYLWKLAGARSPWPRRFLWWTGFAAGLDVTVEGRPLQRDVLFVANHLSWLDILLLGGGGGAAFVSKDEVRRWPVIGWLAGLNHTVFVARAERRRVRGQADELRRVLATGQPVALFPEGTVSGPGALLPFRASLFESVYPPLPRLHVQPVAIDYGRGAEDVSWVEGESIFANARRILSRPGLLPVTLAFLEPIDPATVGDRKALAAAAQAEVEAALDPGASGSARPPLYGGDED